LDGDPHHDYQVVRSNDDWAIHKLRTLVTGGLIAWLRPEIICDPACGDASLLSAAYDLRPFTKAYLGDISIPNIKHLDVRFPHEAHAGDATETLGVIPIVDLVILTEFLEHVPDPDAMLRLARRKSSMLVASSPLGEEGGNAEHLWGWDGEGYQKMLVEAGWNISSVLMLQEGGFIFQIYSAR
jgi:hypothetical protein